MMVRSRRRAVAEIVATVGAVLVSAAVFGRLFPWKNRPTKPGRLPRGETSADRARRVQPAPFAVKRHG
jgi:hypothetical protein